MQLLADLSTTVDGIDRGALQTVVGELGAAFEGTGDDLGQIIDTSNSFIKTANENFEITTSLIRQSRTVLQTQLDKSSAIRSFSKNLALFSGALASSDNSLRALIMALDGMTPDEVVKLELATGVPVVYRLAEDTTIASKEVLG